VKRPKQVQLLRLPTRPDLRRGFQFEYITLPLLQLNPPRVLQPAPKRHLRRADEPAVVPVQTLGDAAGVACGRDTLVRPAVRLLDGDRQTTRVINERGLVVPF